MSDLVSDIESVMDARLGEFRLNLPKERHFFSIGEVSDMLGIKPNVLRHWESNFSQLRPARSSGDHRKYTRDHLEMAFRIDYLINIVGMTAEGAKVVLDQLGMRDARRIEAIFRLNRIKRELGELLSQIAEDK